MKRRIVLEKGQGVMLAKTFELTPQTVSYALNFKNDSELARRIRKAALEIGGIDTGVKFKKEFKEFEEFKILRNH